MHYLSEGQFTLHNFCPKPGFHIVVTVVKIESRSFSTAESQSSGGLGLVACLEGQKINNMPNMPSRKFSYIPKVICAAETQQL